METPKIRNHKTGPEAIIQEAIITFLRAREWMVKETHGNMFQSGFPDLFAANKKYGPRWIEVKNPEKYAFTPAQLVWFPQFTASGVGIWILTAATESEYDKLFKAENWYTFLSAMR